MATRHKKNKAARARNKANRKRVGQTVQSIDPQRTYLRAVDSLLEDDDPDRALSLMQQIETLGSMSRDAMSLYLDILDRLAVPNQYARVSNVMAERFPDDPEATLLAASGAFGAEQPVSAVVYFERFLSLAPEHPEIPNVKEELARLKELLPKILDQFIDDLPKDLPRIASIEKILNVFNLGRLDDVIKRSQRHLQKYPTDLRIRNNLADALALKGDISQALQIINETLELAPNNFFARAVRCRLNFFLGETAESRADAEKLLSMQPKQIGDLAKAAQSFAYLDDQEKIRWAFEQAEQQQWLQEFSSDVAVLTNFYATSLALSGDEKSARSHWRQIVNVIGKATTAHENLDDLQSPPGEQWGPAYFAFHDWLTPSQQDEIRAIVGLAKPGEVSDGKRPTVTEIGRETLRFLKQNPNIGRMIPLILNRGNARCQQFALIIARASLQPEVRSALVAYAQGSRGTDKERRKLLMWLQSEGQALESPFSVYRQGLRHTLEINTFKITKDAILVEGRPETINKLLRDAFIALQQDDGIKAEGILRQVLQMESGQPDVLNNLVAALQLQNRNEEADILVKEITEKYPDYVFAKLALASQAFYREQYDEALKILVDQCHRDSMHFTQFYAVANLFVLAYCGKQDYAAAQYWLDCFEEQDPHYPEIPRLKEFLTEHQRRTNNARKPRAR